MEEIKEIEKVLRLREPIFHNRSLTNSRVDVENETLEDYWEISASGKYYSRQFVLDYLEERYNKESVDASELENWQVKDFKVEKLAEDVFLATYILIGQNSENGGGPRTTRRATIWKGNLKTGFKIKYHQGTVVND